MKMSGGSARYPVLACAINQSGVPALLSGMTGSGKVAILRHGRA